MVECKAQYVVTNGLRPTDWFLAHLDRVGAWGSFLHPLANWAIANRQMRWVMERLLGVAQGRKLPRFAASSFIRRAHRRRLTRPTRRTGRKVVFFVDIYANWHDVQLAEALVAVFEHNGIAVYVPPNQLQSGMAAISIGAVDAARKFAVHNVQLLAEAVRQGYHIVTAEPAAALCLTHEYLNLVDDDDARLVAENTSEACSYLWKLHQEGQLELDLKPVNATLGYHLPCHLRALQVGTPGDHLLRLIPGLTVTPISDACSGMAGTFGLRRANYRSSLRAGWGLISALRSPLDPDGDHRVQCVQDADGTGHDQADRSSAQVPGLVLRTDAGAGVVADEEERGTGGHMKVRVKLFAAARQQVGQDVVHVELPESATVADLRAAVGRRSFPRLQSWASHLLFAVNHQYATDDVPLTADAEIAGFPPVSGG